MEYKVKQAYVVLKARLYVRKQLITLIMSKTTSKLVPLGQEMKFQIDFIIVFVKEFILGSQN